MPLTKTTRSAILRASWSLFHARGYRNTSLQQLADAAGLGKAGLLHHFGSKAGLLRAVLDYADRYYDAHVLSLARSSAPVAERLRAVLTKQLELVRLNDGGGCFYGNMILERGEGGAFNEQLNGFYRAWTAAVTDLLAQRFPAAEAAERAYRLFTDYQGSVMLFKMDREPTHLERFVHRTIVGLDHPIPAYQ